ncbi:MAG: hypothetical protein WDN03_09270 [Rhizomicrobium sp.]
MRKSWLMITLLLPAVLYATAAYAYIGPGAGLSAVGSLVALLGSVALGLIGFIWYPIKRLLKGRKRKSDG